MQYAISAVQAAAKTNPISAPTAVTLKGAQIPAPSIGAPISQHAAAIGNVVSMLVVTVRAPSPTEISVTLTINRASENFNLSLPRSLNQFFDRPYMVR
jgi:hypothetical protein